MSTAALWDALSRPCEIPRAAEALLGISHSAAQVMTAALFVSSPEVDDLLESLPSAMRALSISSAQHLELCHGEVRGPIQWGETISARASSAGDPDYFMCSSPQRAYDTAENRILVAALTEIARAARVVDVGSLRDKDTPFTRHIRRNGAQARRYLEHRALSAVPRGRASSRDRARTRAGTRRRVYRPALDALARLSDPLTADEVELVADIVTVGLHAVAYAALIALRQEGQALAPLRVRDRMISSGPFLFAHPRARVPIGSPTGVLINARPLEEDDPQRVPGAVLALLTGVS